jgi:peroxiredoxin
VTASCLRGIVAGLCLGWAAAAVGGEFNSKLTIGDAAPRWADLPGVDGKKHSFDEFKDRELVVVAFTCNSCPVAVNYEDRLIAFARKYAGPEGKVGFVAINVNTIPEDRLDKMAERAKERKFPFIYLYDETQKIAREYGATTTPEVFLLNKERKVVYMGAMDDRIQEAEVKVRHLEAAVEATLKGEKPSTTETLPRGCRIRYERRKR